MKLVQAYSALNIIEAQLLKNLLEEAGIEARVVNDNLAWVGGELPIGRSIEPKILVRADDEERAKPVVAAFDRRAYERAHQPADEEPDAASIFNYYHLPACQRCGTPRFGKCSYCGARSAVYIEEQYEPDAADVDREARALLCPVCDEPSAPTWDSACEECGTRFANS